MHNWKCNFPMTRSVRLYACRSVGRSVCHNFLKEREHLHAPIRALVDDRSITISLYHNLKKRHKGNEKKADITDDIQLDPLIQGGNLYKKS